VTPQQVIDALDRSLKAGASQMVTLQRPMGARNTAYVSVECRAMVIGYQPHEYSQTPGSGIMAGDSKVVMSPTQINAAQWPGGYVDGPTTQGDQRVPKGSIDRMIVAGRTRAVVAASPTYVDDVLVKLEIQIR